MAQGRMLSKEICIDKQVNELPNDTCRLAFCWAIPHLDRDGRMPGDPVVVKNTVFPRRTDVSPRQMEGFIRAWEASGLVIWYESGGDRYLCFPNFRKHQPKLRYDQEGISRIPAPSDDDIQRFNNVVATFKKPLNGIYNITKEVKRGVVTPLPSPVDKKVYGEDVTLTPEQHAALVAKYGPEAVTRAIEKLSSYKMSKGKKYKSDYHALLQWVFEAIKAEPKARAAPKGWECPHCKTRNTHTGSRCLACKKDRDDPVVDDDEF